MMCHNEFSSRYTESRFMKKLKKISVVVLSTLIFSACSVTNSNLKSQTKPTETGNSQVPAAEQKVGDTTKTGTITQSKGMFFITEIGQEPEMIESYAVDLKKYVGQTVTVTGQYSGDTLFVGSVKK